MADELKIAFAPLRGLAKGVLIVFCDQGLKFGPATRHRLAPIADFVRRAAAAERFTGKSGTVLALAVPAGREVGRLIVIGTGGGTKVGAAELAKFGGAAMGGVPTTATEVNVLAEWSHGPMKGDEVAQLALGMTLRAYRFDRYKTKRKDDDERRSVSLKVTIGTGDVAGARKAWASRGALANGVVLARDLVNEPPNVLFPQEFARRAQALRRAGIVVEILDEAAMKRLGMNALLGVGQGSAHASRAVVMRWNGGRKGEAPLAFIGKGVCFDTGGISIKPAASMEDMKGDMAGAACVVGLMQALAGRKARINAVGVIGLVENMPSGDAQRPGDIVKSMSGQTIEIINTDAEGRLVLADILWYAAKRFKPKFMIDLATLTGAIIIALGHEYAGLFSNDDKLAEQLTKAGEATGEKVWRLPLGPEYDKKIDSRFADVKNTGGREGGSITAAQFLQRFVDGTPWAHLDIAGTGMASPQTEINKSWASGFGVRLLDQLVAEYYEK